MPAKLESGFHQSGDFHKAVPTPVLIYPYRLSSSALQIRTGAKRPAIIVLLRMYLTIHIWCLTFIPSPISCTFSIIRSISTVRCSPMNFWFPCPFRRPLCQSLIPFLDPIKPDQSNRLKEYHLLLKI